MAHRTHARRMGLGMIIVGIDPGLSGAIVALYDMGGLAKSMPMPLSKGKRKRPDVITLVRWIMSHDADVGLVAIETPGPSPRRTSVAATLSIGVGFGMLIGMCEVNHLPYEIVPATRWQGALFGSGKRADKKGESIAYAKRRWPTLDLTPGKRTKPHDGIADAACIAEYGRRLLIGNVARKEPA